MIMNRWQVRFTPAELPSPMEPMPFVAGLPGDWEGWLRRAEVVAGTPFLLSPTLDHRGCRDHHPQGPLRSGSPIGDSAATAGEDDSTSLGVGNQRRR